MAKNKIKNTIEVLEDTDNYKLKHHKGITKFRGCQCYGDCGCSDVFVPKKYDYYSVKKKRGKRKPTTTHPTLEEARTRIEIINNITKN